MISHGCAVKSLSIVRTKNCLLIKKCLCTAPWWHWASLVAQLVKNLPAMRETWVRSLGGEDPLKKGKAAHSNILVGRIPWTVYHMGSQSRGWLSDFHFGGTSVRDPTHQCRRRKRQGFNPWVRKIPWRRTWKSTPVFLPGESHGQRSLVGYTP